MSIEVVILAAGEGKRMHSALPKVLHRLAGKPLLEHVLQTALKLSNTPIIVYGHQGNVLQDAFGHYPTKWVEQSKQLGTGHALLQALPHLSDTTRVLVLYGDVPLISLETLKLLIEHTDVNAVGLLTMELDNPTGYGRIKRHADEITQIVEEKDATFDEKKIKEVNTGIWLIPAKHLKNWLPALRSDNQQQEYYLTDIIKFAVKESIPVTGHIVKDAHEVLGVNDRAQLATLERYYQEQYAKHLMQRGVSIADPKRIDIRGDVIEIGQDVSIDVNVVLEGHIKIGKRSCIGPNTVLRNVIIGDDVEIKAFSHLDGAEIASGSLIGPFARVRPGTILAPKTHIGNFVEVKNSIIGEGSKVNHLSYIGDSEIGKFVNIGAGTITCNYDGVNKHKTIIGDNVHIGSDTQLVAPVRIGEGATIGAGSTITKDTPPNKLVLTHRLEQRIIENWERFKKEEV